MFPDQYQLLSGFKRVDDPTIDLPDIVPKKVRTLFISDIHLGYDGCDSQALVDLLALLEPQTICIIGDLYDGRRKTVDLPQSHYDVVQKLYRHRRKGVDIFYIPGNHDSERRKYLATPPDVPKAYHDGFLNFREAAGEHTGQFFKSEWDSSAAYFQNMKRPGSIFDNMYVVPSMIYEMADGRRILLKHGDEFDPFLEKALYQVGGVARNVCHAMVLEKLIHDFQTDANRKLEGRGLNYIRARNELIKRRQNSQSGWENEPLLDGIGMGHNHMPALIQTQDGYVYFNCGDWVGSNTAITEDFDGRLELVTMQKRNLILHPTLPNHVAPVAEACRAGR